MSNDTHNTSSTTSGAGQTSLEHVKINAQGAVVYWKTADTDRRDLQHALTCHGLEQYLPAQRTPATVLHGALKLLAGRHKTDKVDYAVIRTEDPAINGYEVHDAFLGVQNVVTFAGRYKIDETGVVTCESPYTRDAAFPLEEVQSAVSSQANIVPGASIGRILVNYVKAQHAVTLRPEGAIYWVPEESVPAIEKIAQALTNANDKVKVYLLRTVLDDAAIEAVRDALVSEITQAAEEIRGDLKANPLGDRAIQFRKTKAQQLHERVTRYEAILGETLSVLHAAVQVSETELQATEALEDAHLLDHIYGGVTGSQEN